MVEAVNKIMKYNFFFRQKLFDFNHVQRYLETAVETYNNRPHYSLYGLTPYEVFHGKIPDKNLFKSQMQQAKILRIAENKAISCDNCAFTIEKQEEELIVISLSILCIAWFTTKIVKFLI